MATLNMRMRALYSSNYFTDGPPARRFDNPYFIPSTQVLLQQLVNKGNPVAPPAVATPPARPTSAPSATPASPDDATPGATGTTAPAQERAPPQSAGGGGVRGRDGRRGPGVPATSDKDAFGKKQGVKTPLTDARKESNKRADAIQARFNKAVADQKARDKAGKTAPSKAPAKPAVPRVPSAVATPAPTSTPGPAVRDADYTNLSTFDSASLRGAVREREKQRAKYLAEGLKSSMLIKNTPKNLRGNKFSSKMLKFRQNQGRINDKIRTANKRIQGFLDKIKADKGTSRRIRPSKKPYQSSVGSSNLRGGG